jgi:hypothetical protein
MQLLRATYNVEGDSALVFRCWAIVEAVRVAMLQPVTTATDTVLTDMFGEDNALKAPYTVVLATENANASAYFNERFGAGGPLGSAMAAFKAARFLHPGQARGLNTTLEALRSLTAFKFIKETHVAALKDELPLYLAACEGVSATVKLVEWWQSHLVDLPNFVTVVRMILHVVPKSGAAERVFSMYSNAFRESQGRKLVDIEEATLMPQYNERGHRELYGQVLFADTPVH